ncbi:MAG: biopolymer transport protein TolR [Acidobacteriota bacterium]|jgi:biopolymer transport protein TolR|nr:biopolymer transport protein TolR [Acidobacteriota bacterium]MDT5063834.1 biopolymer transport protein TolR [Acidobacteriota bacterium]
MGMSGGGGSRAVPYINVTPLIDVLLVLLIIFMVVTPLKPKRFKTLIPEQQQNAPQDVTASNLTLRVDILKDNRLQLNQEDIGTIDNTSRLSSTLADVLRKREEQGVYKFGTNIVERTVFIKAPESFKYGDVVKVIDAIKGAGADPVGLQVDALDQ